MLNEIEEFIHNESKGIIATISFLLFILVIIIIWAFISNAFCDVETSMGLKEKFACSNSENFYTTIGVIVGTFLLVGTLGTIYGLYKLGEKIYDYFKYG